MPRLTRSTAAALLTAALALSLLAVPATAGAESKFEKKQDRATRIARSIATRAGKTATSALNGLGALKSAVNAIQSTGASAIGQLTAQLGTVAGLVNDPNTGVPALNSRLPRGGLVKLSPGQSATLLTSGPITVTAVCDTTAGNPRITVNATSSEAGAIDAPASTTFSGATLDQINQLTSATQKTGTLFPSIITPSGFDLSGSGTAGVNALGVPCFAQLSALR